MLTSTGFGDGPNSNNDTCCGHNNGPNSNDNSGDYDGPNSYNDNSGVQSGLRRLYSDILQHRRSSIPAVAATRSH